MSNNVSAYKSAIGIVMSGEYDTVKVTTWLVANHPTMFLKAVGFDKTAEEIVVSGVVSNLSKMLEVGSLTTAQVAELKALKREYLHGTKYEEFDGQNIVWAIKDVRNLVGSSLKGAKDFIESTESFTY
jgi:hypothetical protein